MRNRQRRRASVVPGKGQREVIAQDICARYNDVSWCGWYLAPARAILCKIVRPDSRCAVGVGAKRNRQEFGATLIRKCQPVGECREGAHRSLTLRSMSCES